MCKWRGWRAPTQVLAPPRLNKCDALSVAPMWRTHLTVGHRCCSVARCRDPRSLAQRLPHSELVRNGRHSARGSGFGARAAGVGANFPLLDFQVIHEQHGQRSQRAEVKKSREQEVSQLRDFMPRNAGGARPDETRPSNSYSTAVGVRIAGKQPSSAMPSWRQAERHDIASEEAQDTRRRKGHITTKTGPRKMVPTPHKFSGRCQVHEQRPGMTLQLTPSAGCRR